MKLKTMKTLTTAISSAALLALAVAPLPGEAQPLNSVIDDSGAVYTLLKGNYEDILVGRQSVPGDHPVLALEVARSTGTREVHLVQGTGGPEEERAERLLYHGPSDTIFVVWEQPRAQDSNLRVSSWKDHTWASLVELRTERALAEPPQLLVTEENLLGTEGSQAGVSRTTLHLAWTELADSTESQDVFYAPVILEDGVFIGSTSRTRLNDLESEAGEPVAGGPASSSLSLQAGTDLSTVLVSYFSLASGRAVTVEIGLMPRELGMIAQSVSRSLLDLGPQYLAEGDVNGLAQAVGEAASSGAAGLHESLRIYFEVMTEQIVLERLLGGSGPGLVLENEAGGIGGAVIDIGFRIFADGGLERTFAAEREQVLQVTSANAAGGEPPPLWAEGSLHLLRLYVTSDRLAPETGDGPVTIISSEDGVRSLVSWEGPPGTILYRQTQGEDEWSDAQSLTLGDDLDRETAMEILRQRIRKR